MSVFDSYLQFMDRLGSLVAGPAKEMSSTSISHRAMQPFDLLLLYSARKGDAHAAGVALDAGADVNAAGGLALAIAAQRGDMDMAQLLLSRNANVHASHGVALHAAAQGGNVDVVNLVLDHGADAHDPEATRLAVENGHEAIAELLQRRAAEQQTPEPETSPAPAPAPQHFRR